MEDEGEPLDDLLRDGERENNMTRYEDHPNEDRPYKRPKIDDKFESKYDDDNVMPDLEEEAVFSKANVSQSAVYNNEPYYEHPESSYPLTESQYDPLAERLETIEMSSWETSSLRPLGETPQEAAIRQAQLREWVDEQDQKLYNEVKESDDRLKANQRANERDQKFDQDALDRKAREAKESMDKEQESLNQQLKDINKKFNDERTARLEAKSENVLPGEGAEQ